MATTVEAYALSRDEGTAIWFLGTLMTLKATGEQTKGTYGLIEQLLPSGFSPPLHVHHNEDEAFYLLAGEASFTCGDQTLKARPGSFIFFPRDIPHWFHIEGTEPARLLQFNFPAGLEHFFLEVGEPAPELTLPPAEPPDVGKLVAIAAKYNLEILGPPPA
jgi:mannose-6-phosphate isomerase-like protein (cupin superfamily)